LIFGVCGDESPLHTVSFNHGHQINIVE